MSVCQYYLRGNCRYGDRCRLPHGNSNEPRVHYPNDSAFRPRPPRPSINPNCTYIVPSVANQNHHVENTNASTKTNFKCADVYRWAAENFADIEKALNILEQLQREARAWQKSIHFWRFTSKSLFPGGRPLKGWYDQSFEEIKWTHRQMSNQDQEHVYKKDYYDYFENTERHLFGLSSLCVDTLNSLKDYINEYVVSDYKPSKTLKTDVEMNDVNGNTPSSFVPSTDSTNSTPSNFHPPTYSTNYTPNDQLLEDERAAFERDTFEFGKIPVQAPSEQFC